MFFSTDNKQQITIINWEMEVKDAETPTKFVNEPSGSLYCPICRKLFENPSISITCGHTFCRSCVSGQLKRSSMVCPLDSAQVDMNNLVPNKAVQGQVEDVLIYCRHGLAGDHLEGEDWMLEETGCKEHIKLGQRDDHEQNCPKEWISCPNSRECIKFRREDLTNHMKDCSFHSCPNESQGTINKDFHIKSNF